MRRSFTVEGRFPSLNEFYRMSPGQQGRVKRECDEAVAKAAKAARIPYYAVPVRYTVRWVEANRRRDLDNVAFGKKFVQDGLVRAGVISNDSYREIVGFEDEFAYDGRNPRIEITIEKA